MMLPKLVITDIDGVWTDGGMYYDQTGNEWKKFCTFDSAGVIFLRLLGIPVAIITGENTQIMINRAKKLKIDLLFQGVHNKVKVADGLRKSLNLQWEDIAYIGDDIGDMTILTKVGFSGCPAQSPDYIKDRVHFITKKRGGEGAFREFVEHILAEEHVLEKALMMYEKSIAE